MPRLFDPNGDWAARTRPLNRYLITGGIDEKEPDRTFDMFACPSDQGFPENRLWVKNMQVANILALTDEIYEKRFFDFLGNSYRYNTIGLINLQGGVGGSFSSGVMGSRYTKLDRGSSRVVLYSEPLFYMMTVPDQNLNPELAPLRGTHKVLMTENVVYADGSARPTKVGSLARFTVELLLDMGYGGVGDYDSFLRRGTTWQTDAYPTPGSVVRAYNGTTMVTNNNIIAGLIGAGTGWPGKPRQDNTLRD
jgi:hypothetical protein